MTRSLRIAVLSDLHFGSSEEGRQHTHVITGRAPVAKQHPFHDLRALIARDELRADVVLCPGDITLQADAIGLESAWSALNQIRDDLRASHLLTATGNHDITSRGADQSPEIWERLRQLDPPYPYPEGSRLQLLQYWAEHFFCASVGRVRFVVLNTCNCHSRGAAEFAHGRVTDYTIDLMEREIVGDVFPLNILLCHHHPVKQPELSQVDLDYSEMVQGRRLLSMLEESSQPWLVVHGHKHNPRLEYAQGASGDVPVIFSAGSFSAVLSPVHLPTARNQFYVIEFDLDYVKANGVAGVIRSWDWAAGTGWVSAKPEEEVSARVPNGAGFGHRANAADARAIVSRFDGAEQIAWADVQLHFPALVYMTPSDLKRLLARLKNDHSYEAQKLPGSIFPIELLKVSK